MELLLPSKYWLLNFLVTKVSYFPKSHTSHRDQTPVKREIQIQLHRPGASKS